MQAPQPRLPILVISSHVADNSVGGRLTEFALARLGFPIWFVPSITLARHPKRGPGTITRPDLLALRNHLGELVAAHKKTPLSAVLTGYLGHADQVPVIAETIDALREHQPDLAYLCDPVLGDGSGLYVSEALAEAIRDLLLPRAQMATPNLFEAGWLLDQLAPLSDAKALLEALNAARHETRPLPSKLVVTSTPGLMQGHIGNLLWQREESPVLFEHPIMPRAFNGTGDLLSGLLLGQSLIAGDLDQACQKASASLFELTARAAKAGLQDLQVITEQSALERPVAMVHRRQLAAAASPAIRTSGTTQQPVYKPKAL